MLEATKNLLTAAVKKLWQILPNGVRYRMVRITQPKFTASAAAVILNDKDQVLVLNHVLRPYSGWGLPGGFLDAGEQPRDAIRREIFEEVGIELNDLVMFRVRVVSRHIEMLFKARAVGEPAVKSREITEVKWFAFDDLPADMSLAQKTIIARVLRDEV